MSKSVKPVPLSWPLKLVLGAILLVGLMFPLLLSGWLFWHGYQMRDPSITPLLYIAALCALAFSAGQCRVWWIELDLGRPKHPGDGS